MRHVRYRGRHRTASTAGRLTAVGAVGVGTAAVTVLAPMAAAHAASGSQWDRVAQCESGGNWHDNTGNGYYGGLQFSASTWDGYGGRSYAPRADEASASAQQAIANRVLAAQGWGAWPVCSRVAGVSGEPTATGVQTQQLLTSNAKPSHGSSSPTFVPSVKGAHYRVKHGDTLSDIAARHQVKGGWEAIYHANRTVIGNNPSLILPGMKLKI